MRGRRRGSWHSGNDCMALACTPPAATCASAQPSPSSSASKPPPPARLGHGAVGQGGGQRDVAGAGVAPVGGQPLLPRSHHRLRVAALNQQRQHACTQRRRAGGSSGRCAAADRRACLRCMSRSEVPLSRSPAFSLTGHKLVGHVLGDLALAQRLVVRPPPLRRSTHEGHREGSTGCSMQGRSAAPSQQTLRPSSAFCALWCPNQMLQGAGAAPTCTSSSVSTARFSTEPRASRHCWL